MKKIALVPVFNEAKNIISVLTELEGYVDEILIVNDGSWDRTEPLVTAWLERGRRGRLITLSKNHGNAGAVMAGYAFIDLRLHAGTVSPQDVVITIDADGQHKPGDVPRLLAFMVENDLDFVRGKRRFEKYPRHKIIGNKLLSALLSPAAGVKLADAMSGYCLQRAYTIPPLLDYVTAYRYSLQGEMAVILPRLGYRTADGPAIDILYFQSHTRYRDALINVVLGMAALARVKLGLKSRRHQRGIDRHAEEEKRRAA